MAADAVAARLAQAARKVGEELLAQSRRTPGGYATWLGPAGYGTRQNPLRVVQVGPFLYDGTSGIALFLAALARTTGEDTFRHLAWQTLSPLRDKVLELAAAPERASRLNLSLGGLMGVGSYIYALLRTGTLLEEQALVDAAHAATQLVTSERIAQDRRARVQTGSAGAILALLALHHERPGRNALGRTPLELASECARHLLEGRVPLFEGGPRAWPLSPGKPPLGGFSYGAAGICHALLQVDAKAPDPEVRQAALEGLAFLRALYSPGHGNWRDVRAGIQARVPKSEESTWKDFWFEDGKEAPSSLWMEHAWPPVDSFEDSWCHGGTGIAPGQLASLGQVDSPEIREQLHRVLVALATQAPGPERGMPDDLCCGSLGQAEVLQEASFVLQEERWRTAALAQAEAVLQRAEATLRYEVSAARGTDVFAPSLFQGVAGVGYAFLRLAFPGALPCVLRLQ